MQLVVDPLTSEQSGKPQPITKIVPNVEGRVSSSDDRVTTEQGGE